MWKTITKGSPFLFGTFLPLDWVNHDKISDENIKSAKDHYLSKRNNETGKERIAMMFTIDEFGNMSNELNAITQAGFLGGFVGAMYGGILGSRIAYMNFMENNEATAFQSHLDAKKKLQDKVTLSFARGAFRWGWRLALFTTSYVGIVTVMSVYRGKSSIWEYLAAGSATGAVYKLNMGLRGMAAGGIVGLAFGGVAGGLSLGIMKITGTTMEEVRYWQYKWKTDRDGLINDLRKDQPEYKEPLMDKHDEELGEEILSLDFVDGNPEKDLTSKETVKK